MNTTRSSYPLEVLPVTIRNAVIEAAEATGQSISFLSACALSAVSLAVQAYVDVKQGPFHDSSPVWLYFLSLTAPGQSRMSIGMDWFMGVFNTVQNKDIASPKLTFTRKRLRYTKQAITSELSQSRNLGVISSEPSICRAILKNRRIFESIWKKQGSLWYLDFLDERIDIQADSIRQTIHVSLNMDELMSVAKDQCYKHERYHCWKYYMIDYHEFDDNDYASLPETGEWHFKDLFDERLGQILSEVPPISWGGKLMPRVLNFSKIALSKIELTRNSGSLLNVDHFDIGLNQVARLAALFHVFENGINGDITEKSVDRAVAVVSWHLSQTEKIERVI